MAGPDRATSTVKTAAAGASVPAGAPGAAAGTPTAASSKAIIRKCLMRPMLPTTTQLASAKQSGDRCLFPEVVAEQLVEFERREDDEGLAFDGDQLLLPELGEGAGEGFTDGAEFGGQHAFGGLQFDGNRPG